MMMSREPCCLSGLDFPFNRDGSKNVKGMAPRMNLPTQSHIPLGKSHPSPNVSVAVPAEPRGEKKTFFWCKFWAVRIF